MRRGPSGFGGRKPRKKGLAKKQPKAMVTGPGEKMRQLAYYYMANPEQKKWGLPWKVLMRKRDQLDPVFAR